MDIEKNTILKNIFKRCRIYKMRFIRKEHIITTICNTEVSEEEIINSLLKNLKERGIEFSLTIKKYFSSIHDYKNIIYEKVRVEKIGDSIVDFIILDKSVIMHLKSIFFSDIVEISAITTIDKILKTKSKLTRFDLIDIDDE